MDVLYQFLVLVHVLGAICGLGATFASPYIMRGGSTVPTAKIALSVNEKVEKLAKIGSFTLLGTGLIMGAINTQLFSMGWYLISIGLYILLQPVVAYLMPKHAKGMAAALEQAEGNDLPAVYGELALKVVPLTRIAQVALVVIVFFMVFKPF